MITFINTTLHTPTPPIPDAVLIIDGPHLHALGPATTTPIPPNSTIIDAHGHHLGPGFIDLQLNGAFGHDFTQNPETIWSVAAQLPQYGVTSFLPTIITSPPATIPAAQKVWQNGPPHPTWRGATPLGLHLEGPVLNPAKKGAHDPAFIRLPHHIDSHTWSRDHGIYLVTLAPEQPDALAWAQTLRHQQIVISAGHTAADYDTAWHAFDQQISSVTHLFNAMPPLHHRQPALTLAALHHPHTYLGLIADGIHVHPHMINLAWQLAANRIYLVTDGMAALGMPPGHYHLSNRHVIVTPHAPRLPDGTLAGSILSLDTALRNLINYTNCTLTQAWRAATLVPAQLLNLHPTYGQLRPGALANLVLLDEQFHVTQTWLHGQRLYP
ncbi:MAG TPA: N-acetylglucosamine-6-phosphate deacetylase [Anaerolineae bacterium]|nr:N-acetylglucosamine-6-phosphate deacetylase [Anaerolineae bacterium]